ncbi:hypothetical protein BK126_02885 [Paenibacillus sp. FSL H7-0326]|uniref:LytTR family transcriptional regulator DNA-binding domain-containing protein n=1 Tax=Paenibacillus sp. FSL H7-0326 TaxID=1921144 RepID=UPI00096FBDC6|nr:hypothetical protein BK126_02885 [Paenibacillus sp. FSL H7-0326]
MSYVSVSRDPEGNTGIYNLLIKDVKYLKYDKKINRVILHTESEKFYVVGTIEFWTNAFNGSGFTFRIVDRSNSINVDHIQKIDTVFKVVYLDRSKKDLFKCTMSVKQYNALVGEFPYLTRSAFTLLT